MAKTNPLERQVGGSHYKDGGPQHVEFCQLNRIPWGESCALKYILRHRRKNGKEDLEKAIHYLEFVMAIDYGRRDKVPQDIQPKGFIIGLGAFLKDKALTSVERVIIDKIIMHQQKGETLLMDAVKLLKQMVQDEYGESPLPKPQANVVPFKKDPEPEIEGAELL